MRTRATQTFTARRWPGRLKSIFVAWLLAGFVLSAAVVAQTPASVTLFQNVEKGKKRGHSTPVRLDMCWKYCGGGEGPVQVAERGGNG